MRTQRRFGMMVLGLAALALLLGSGGPVSAGPIVYTVQTTASGSLGGTPFSNALVTVSFTGDTSNVTGGGGFFTNTVGTATVNVAGLGTATFTDSMEAFVNQTFVPPAAGIADTTIGGSVLDTFNAAFATYDLRSFIGPLSGAPFINPGESFPTNRGGFILNSAGNSTFQAASPTVPEPSTLALLALGGGALAGWRRWRKRSTK
jgi:hypothetical protein